MNVYKVAQLRRMIGRLEGEGTMLAKIRITWYSLVLKQELKD